MAKDLLEQSALLLKQTVPLMVKYQIPTTPTNYAIWYTYSAGTTPALNTAMDHAIEQGQHFYPTFCQTLYSSHIASEAERDIDQVKRSLEAMAIEMNHSMDDTLAGTQAFQSALRSGFQRLAEAEQHGITLDEVMKLVRDLLRDSGDIETATNVFSNELTQAQAEISQLKSALSESRKEAHEDALTKIYNRRAFDQDLASWTQLGTAFSVIVLDLDHFKAFNDNFGHQLGDQVLKAVARRLNDNCRDGIQAYRIGGEEFALIAPHKVLAPARQLAESVRKQIDKLAVKDKFSGKSVNTISASFGVAQHQSDISATQLLHSADEQLIKAKQLGRNRVMPLLS
uniref:GGDEF domain-containing protein n=1 Tax=Thaumasiovibrio occultus TaxID=1891184 RepID=UPI000B3603D6|nr:GGDEF domain-containing protein [Thaumasiovibrio occultus]